MQIELAVGVVSRMRVAVRFEIGRPSSVSTLALSCLVFRAVAWSGWSGPGLCPAVEAERAGGQVPPGARGPCLR